jgi:hypothetical protein
MADLSEDQIERLVRAIEKVERKRKIMLLGYMVALLCLVLGQLVAFFIYSAAPPGTFVGWVFFVPFTLVGLVLWAVGRWARSIR